MLVLLEDAEEIAAAQRSLQATFRKALPNTATRNIGYPGGSRFAAKVFTNSRYWYWSSARDAASEANPRRLNWLGLFEDGDNHLQISVEVNTPFEGRNDQVAGFFARDAETGVTYLMHSGRVGGGAKGVGKTAFLAWHGATPARAVDRAGQPCVGNFVMPIDGKGAVRSALKYVDSVVAFKRAVRAASSRVSSSVTGSMRWRNSWRSCKVAGKERARAVAGCRTICPDMTKS
jgi:hypothetical protein